MKFYEFGDKELPAIVLIHGGGRSYWMYLRQARMLQNQYRVILPVLDGHGEEYDTIYTNTETMAQKIIAYVDQECEGKLLAISGVSLGGQIAVEVLSQRGDIAKKAILESCVCSPQPKIGKWSNYMFKFGGKVLFSETFTKSIKLMPKKSRLPEEIETLFIRDLPKMRQESLVNFTASYYENYTLKESLRACEADTMYWYGSREMKCIKESAQLVASYMKKCQVIELEKYAHAEITEMHPEEWVKRADTFFRS